MIFRFIGSNVMSRNTRLSVILAVIIFLAALLLGASWFLQVFGRGGF